MNHTYCRTFVRFLPFVCLVLLACPARADQWTAPTPEELKMTSQPEVPGAAAVYLNREEITDDHLHMWSKYARIKVLTEAGKEFANVELMSRNSTEEGGYNIAGIAGRTIHPDGTIIPFTGKPLEKLIEKGQGFKVMAKVFTLPDVEVGSIIEYRYELEYDDNLIFPPKWYIQSDLFTRKAHYVWKTAGNDVVLKDAKGEQVSSRIAWTPILPKDCQVKQTEMPGGVVPMFEVTAQNVPPTQQEEFMPPIESLSYRVLFYFMAETSKDEFWKNEGKRWSQVSDKFIGPNNGIKTAVKDIVVPTDTEEQKLRKIYAAVMKLDNSSYGRARSSAEDKSQGLGEIKNADDIWQRKRGNDDEITELFVSMARAAGLKAYLMTVVNRDRSLFLQGYLSMEQFDDDIAIVVVDGKEQVFDPGQRYCPYGQLAWKHTLVQGLRQTDGGTAFANTPGAGYKDSRTDRVADLTMDEHGEATGTITMTYRGAPALRWRQVYLRGDAMALNHDFQTSMEHLLPGGMEVKVKSMEKLDDYEEPLKVTFDVKGQIASSTGKRLLVPNNIFLVNAKPTFPHEKRELPVYFDYASTVLDAVRVTFPASLGVESVPASDQMMFQKTAAYTIQVAQAPTSVTVRRNLLIGDIIFDANQYTDLRAFYNKFEAKDQEPFVLKAAAGSGGN